MDFPKMAITGVGLYLMSYIDKTDPATIQNVRYGFAAVSSISFILQFLVYLAIKSKTDNIEVEVKNSEINPPATGVTVLPADDPIIKITTSEYDYSEWIRWARASVMPFIMTLGLHLYFGFLPPLVLSPVSTLYDNLFQPLVRIHVYGQTVRSYPELGRPFKKPKAEGLMEMIKKIADPDAAVEPVSADGAANKTTPRISKTKVRAGEDSKSE